MQIMVVINCKQVPLCARHCKALYNNSLSSIKRKLFAEGIKNVR